MMTPLKYFRLSQGIKQKELAKQLGMNNGYLSNIENGKLRGTKETRRKIAELLRVPEGVLFAPEFKNKMREK
jgi:transcriptional regulator with XRE-family HTH domain